MKRIFALAVVMAALGSIGLSGPAFAGGTCKGTLSEGFCANGSGDGDGDCEGLGGGGGRMAYDFQEGTFTYSGGPLGSRCVLNLVTGSLDCNRKGF